MMDEALIENRLKRNSCSLFFLKIALPRGTEQTTKYFSSRIVYLWGEISILNTPEQESIVRRTLPRRPFLSFSAS
jgi:hypothetical protein